MSICRYLLRLERVLILLHVIYSFVDSVSTYFLNVDDTTPDTVIVADGKYREIFANKVYCERR